MKVLVVEDTPTQAAMVKLGLQRLGHEVVLAKDGIDAMEKVYQSPPDLIVSDVVMPRLNGYQVCRLLKDDEQTASIPIILLTSLDQRQDMFWGLKSGADKYLTKGGDIPTFVREVQSFIEEWYRQGTSRRKGPVTVREPSDLGFDVMERVIKLLDRNLFESTVINEIQNLVNTLDNYQKTIVSVLEIISRVVDFHAGVILLEEEDRPELHVFVKKSVTEAFLASLGSEAERLFSDLSRRESITDAVTSVSHAEDLVEEPGVRPGEIRSLSSSTLSTKGRPSGLVVLASSEAGVFDERTRQTFEIIVRQANIVIDYARLHERTKQLSITDGLTKVYNHRYFQEQLHREFARSQRHKSFLSLILLDIDHFKRFNDTYGHQQGDIVLRELARVLQTQIRSCDLLARYGGEEFAIIMPDCEAGVCVRASERLRGAVENKAFPGQERQLSVTISMGVSTMPHREIGTPAELISAADQALYRAKEKGRNRVEC